MWRHSRSRSALSLQHLFLHNLDDVPDDDLRRVRFGGANLFMEGSMHIDFLVRRAVSLWGVLSNQLLVAYSGAWPYSSALLQWALQV